MLTVSKLTFDELWRRYPGDMWRVSPGAGVGSGISTVARVGTIPIRAATDHREDNLREGHKGQV